MINLDPPVTSDDHIEGPLEASVTLVEFGDFCCPESGRVFPIVKSLQDEFKSRLRFVFRHFPAADGHPHSRDAAAAAEAAGRQRRFWQMHDLLFEHQQQLDAASLQKYAAELRLNLHAFADERQGEDVVAHLNADIESGVRSGVTGTPTFFVNGERHAAGHDYASLRAAVETALAGRGPA